MTKDRNTLLNMLYIKLNNVSDLTNTLDQKKNVFTYDTAQSDEQESEGKTDTDIDRNNHIEIRRWLHFLGFKVIIIHF